MLTREELEQIPLRYRWLLKLFLRLPNPSIPFAVLKKLPEIEGVFWAVLAPIFLVLYFFFDIWLFSYLSLHFGFPLNVFLGLLMPAVVFVFFLRIQLERMILWWRNVRAGSREWEVSRRVEELVEAFKKQRKRE